MLIKQSCQRQSCMCWVLGVAGSKGFWKMHVSEAIGGLKTQANSMDTHSVAINFYIGSTLDLW